MANPNQATATYELVAAGAADPNRARGQIALVDAAGGPAVPTRTATAIASLPGAGNTIEGNAAKINEILVALRAAGIITA